MFSHFAMQCWLKETRPTVLHGQAPYKVVGIVYWYFILFFLVIQTYSPICYELLISFSLLITFSLIMLDSPRLLLSMATWLFFLPDGSRRSSKDIFTKDTFLWEHSFMVKSCVVVGGWVACEIILSSPGLGVLSISHSHFPIPISPNHFPFPFSRPQSQSPIPGPGQGPVPIAWQLKLHLIALNIA